MNKRIVQILFSSFIIFLFNTAAFSASSGSIEGYVLDSQNENPLPGANVYIKGLSIGASTDIDGKYYISNVAPGSYTLIVEYVGYTKKEVKVTVKQGQTVKQVVLLDFKTLEGEAINVTVQAEGQMAAINQQLASNKVVNVVSAARIQELPDNNAAESVGRLPGVSIKRSGGEGNKVVIRGLSPKFNSITVNGVKMASTSGSDRSTDISMISPYMLQGIEVVKAITPDMDADILGGTVNFKLKGAPVNHKGLKLNAIAQGGYSKLTDYYGNYKFVISGSDRFFSNKFGIFAQLDVENRDRSSDNLQANYYPVNPSLDVWNKVQASSIQFQQVDRKRKRYGGALVLDYQFQNGSILFSNFANKSAVDASQNKETFDAQANTHSYGINDNSNDLLLMTNALNFEYNINRYHIDASVSNSFSENNAPLTLNLNFNELSAFNNQEAYNDPFAIIDSAKNDIDNTYINTLTANRKYNKDNQTTAAVNMEINLNLSNKISSKIKFGGKYRHQYKYNDEKVQSRSFQPYRYTMDSVRAYFPWMNTMDVGSAVREKLPYRLFIDPNHKSREFLDGEFEFGPVADFNLLHDLYNMLNTTPDNVRIGLNGAPLLWYNWPSSIKDDYHGTEDYSAGYLMAEINFGNKWMILPGVRYENYKTTYTAARGDDSYRIEEGYNYHDTTMTQVHGFWLPMIHVKYDATKWLTFRLAYTQTLSRPNFKRIIPAWNLSYNNNSLSYKNYRLLPAQAYNYDFSMSVYENHVGLFTAGLFYKEIDDLVYNPGQMVLSDPAEFNLPDFMKDWTISTTINNKYKAQIWGLELDWQTQFWYLPKPLNGLVLNVNYTHIKSETKYPRVEMNQVIVGYDTTYVFGQERIRPIWGTVNNDTFYTARLLNQPDDIINISLGYDYKGFSARVSMLYTDNIFAGTDFWPEMRTFTDSQVRWDLAIKQKLPVKGLEVYYNLNNFTNAVDRTLIAGNPNPQKEEHYGMTMDIGIRYKF